MSNSSSEVEETYEKLLRILLKCKSFMTWDFNYCMHVAMSKIKNAI